MDTPSVSAVRGAIQVGVDSKEAIALAAQKLFTGVLKANDLQEEQVAALLITQTGDLRSLNPATGLRMGGLASRVPLFCMPELEIEGMMARVIRMLFILKVHKGDLQPVYLDGAELLRPDLARKE
ncbi:MAG: chorismate mutase [Spirochaetales bacterium]|nr:chorismate mutase [Spirochaetales bacterium]